MKKSKNLPVPVQNESPTIAASEGGISGFATQAQESMSGRPIEAVHAEEGLVNEPKSSFSDKERLDWLSQSGLWGNNVNAVNWMSTVDPRTSIDEAMRKSGSGLL